MELDKQVKGISSEALEQLEKYAWPGNLRELRNVIRRAVLFTTGEYITPDSLPLLSANVLEEDHPEDISLVMEPIDEKEKIIRALERTKGNKTKAAQLLQIDRKTLYNKLHAYGIEL